MNNFGRLTPQAKTNSTPPPATEPTPKPAGRKGVFAIAAIVCVVLLIAFATGEGRLVVVGLRLLVPATALAALFIWLSKQFNNGHKD